MFEKKKITNCYTIDECIKCKSSSQRKFNVGDYLFKEVSSCNSCGEKAIIIRIFGETIEQ